MRVQSAAVIVQFAGNTGKVEIQHQVTIAVICGMLPYVEVAKQGIKLVTGTHIIIVLQHIQCQTLAETSWTDKEEIPVRTFY